MLIAAVAAFLIAHAAYLMWHKRFVDSLIGLLREGRKLRAKWEAQSDAWRTIARRRGLTIRRLERQLRARRQQQAKRRHEIHALRRRVLVLEAYAPALVRGDCVEVVTSDEPDVHKLLIRRPEC